MFFGIFVDSGLMWARMLHWLLGLKTLPTGLGFKVGQNIPFYTTVFFTAMTFFSCNACVSMNNQECKVKPEITNINSNKPSFYPNSIFINKCSGSGSNINNLYAKSCIPDVIKNMNIKLFNQMSRTNETRHVS